MGPLCRQPQNPILQLQEQRWLTAVDNLESRHPWLKPCETDANTQSKSNDDPCRMGNVNVASDRGALSLASGCGTGMVARRETSSGTDLQTVFKTPFKNYKQLRAQSEAAKEQPPYCCFLWRSLEYTRPKNLRNCLQSEGTGHSLTALTSSLK
jgi:hypothetical protein